MRSAQRAERAGHRGDGPNCARRVSPASGTSRNAASRVQLDVRRQVTGQARSRTARGLAGFQRPLIGRRVNLAEVVDTGILLRGGTRFHKVRNRDRGQQTDNGHYNHDFYQREARLAEVLVRFHFLLIFLYRGVKHAAGGFYDYDFAHWIACCNHDACQM